MWIMDHGSVEAARGRVQLPRGGLSAAGAGAAALASATSASPGIGKSFSCLFSISALNCSMS